MRLITCEYDMVLELALYPDLPTHLQTFLFHRIEIITCIMLAGEWEDLGTRLPLEPKIIILNEQLFTM